ncbi:hypothetical protein ACSLFT_08780 [Streptomyces sp. G6]|uniref:hypothetical protein n=1 Tax=Streptomyces sp. G6 TaxID=1178736 RepID=UPI003ED9CD82
MPAPHVTPPARRPVRLVAITASALSVLAGCASPAASPGTPAPSAGTSVAAPAPADDTTDRATARDTTLPGVGPTTLAGIPDSTRQVLLATGDGKNAGTSTVALYERTSNGWEQVRGPWPAHNALRGWTDDHRLGDLRSPIGVFRLTDAGGLLPDPGTRLSYDRSNGFSVSGTGFEGEPLAGSFDYVVAINYNREAGTTPLDWTRPLGAEKGGGIWIHVDHEGPTQACVSIAKSHMKQLLLALDPDLDPAIVMGDAASLSR